MSREDFVAIAARLFAVFLLLTVLKQVPVTLQFISQDSSDAWVAPYTFVLIAGLVLCAILWFFPLTVARKLLPVMREARSEQSLDASIAMSVGLTLIGVWVLAYGLVDAVYWVTMFLRLGLSEVSYSQWPHDHVAGLLATVVEVLIAIYLIFGSSGIRRLIQRYRYGPSAGP